LALAGVAALASVAALAGADDRDECTGDATGEATGAAAAEPLAAPSAADAAPRPRRGAALATGGAGSASSACGGGQFRA
jgi:hypothetical protein